MKGERFLWAVTRPTLPVALTIVNVVLAFVADFYRLRATQAVAIFGAIVFAATACMFHALFADDRPDDV